MKLTIEWPSSPARQRHWRGCARALCAARCQGVVVDRNAPGAQQVAAGHRRPGIACDIAAKKVNALVGATQPELAGGRVLQHAGIPPQRPADTPWTCGEQWQVNLMTMCMRWRAVLPGCCSRPGLPAGTHRWQASCQRRQPAYYGDQACGGGLAECWS